MQIRPCAKDLTLKIPISDGLLLPWRASQRVPYRSSRQWTKGTWSHRPTSWYSVLCTQAPGAWRWGWETQWRTSVSWQLGTVLWVTTRSNVVGPTPDQVPAPARWDNWGMRILPDVQKQGDWYSDSNHQAALSRRTTNCSSTTQKERGLMAILSFQQSLLFLFLVYFWVFLIWGLFLMPCNGRLIIYKLIEHKVFHYKVAIHHKEACGL